MQVAEIEKERSIAIFNMLPIIMRSGKPDFENDIIKSFLLFSLECNVESAYWIVDQIMVSATTLTQYSGKLIPTSEQFNHLVEKHVRKRRDIKLVVAYGSEQDLECLKATVGHSCKIFFASDGDVIPAQDTGSIRIIPGHIPQEMCAIRWWMTSPRAFLNTPPSHHPENVPGGFVQEHDAYAQNGFTLQKEGNYVEALKSFRRAVALNPRCLRALGGMSFSLLDMADLLFASPQRDALLQEAESALLNSIQIDPSYEPARSALEMVRKAGKGRTPEEVEVDVFNNLKEKQKLYYTIGLSLEDAQFIQEYAQSLRNPGGGKEFLRRNGLDHLPKVKLFGLEDALDPNHLQALRILGNKFGETCCVKLYHFVRVFGEMAANEPYYVMKAFESMIYKERKTGRKLLIFEYAKARGRGFLLELEKKMQDQPRSVLVVNDLCLPTGILPVMLFLKPEYAVAFSVRGKKEEHTWQELQNMEVSRLYPILNNATEVTFSAYSVQKPK